ncbi:uncharacterized protein [Elaeis guineensis]|uniref:uncharacterized protein isoform X1 n=1 Tax=Elaeis guineensis var. tenera TaxID=51953 RepID=UPI003C6D8135
MKLAPKVIFLVRDPDGFGPAIADALLPSSESKFTRETSSFELSLEKYGIGDRKASGDLIEFVDPHGSPQARQFSVSILLLPNYGPPIAACAVKEVLALISSEESSNHTTIILPYVMKALMVNQELANPASSERKVMLYGAEIGGTTDIIQSMIAETATPPLLQIHCESLACLLQMVRVLNLPTVLIASHAPDQSKRSAGQEFEAWYEVGHFLANHMGLCFSKERLQQKGIEKPRSVQEPWRALYG